jgi:hypothetical protein
VGRFRGRFGSVQDVTIGFTLLHSSKQKDQPPWLSGDDRSTVAPSQRDASSRPQAPVQPVS